jgi:hypothetical protein
MSEKVVSPPPLLILKAAIAQFPAIIRQAIEAGTAARRVFLSNSSKLNKASAQTAVELRRNSIPTLSLTYKQVADIAENLHKSAFASSSATIADGGFQGTAHEPNSKRTITSASTSENTASAIIPASMSENTASNAVQKSSSAAMRVESHPAEAFAAAPKTKEDSSTPLSEQNQAATAAKAIAVWEAPTMAIAWREHHLKQRPFSRGQSFSRFAAPHVMQQAARHLSAAASAAALSPSVANGDRTPSSSMSPLSLLPSIQNNPNSQHSGGRKATTELLPHLLAPKLPALADDGTNVMSRQKPLAVGAHLPAVSSTGMAFDSFTSPAGHTKGDSPLRREVMREAIAKHRKRLAQGSAVVSKLKTLEIPSDNTDKPRAAPRDRPVNSSSAPLKAMQQAARTAVQLQQVWHR